MYRETSKLLLYGDLKNDEILLELSRIFEDWEQKREDKPILVRRIYAQVKRLLDLATTYAFDVNLWHNYLTFLLMTNENSFSLTCELAGASEGGSVNLFAKADFEVFKRLFDFDFKPIEEDLGINCFSILSDYKAIPKKELMYNRSVSEKVKALSAAIEKATDTDEIFRLVTEHYRKYGVGLFGMNKAFRVKDTADGVVFQPINNIVQVVLDDLIGYEEQKRELRRNTEAFVQGRGCNNMLLYGDAGTGKSTSVKAILNEYADQGLRMIELYKHQFGLLSEIISKVKNRNCRFMIFIDDLSFEENEVEYKFLKAVIEGGIETRPENVLICATSNRRHLIRETWKDRSDMEFKDDVHRSDTMEEKLSLAARFGCAINYNAPTRGQYHDIIRGLASRAGEIDLPEEKLLVQANAWEIRHGGVSGRTAQQFINYLTSSQKEKKDTEE